MVSDSNYSTTQVYNFGGIVVNLDQLLLNKIATSSCYVEDWKKNIKVKKVKKVKIIMINVEGGKNST